MFKRTFAAVLVLASLLAACTAGEKSGSTVGAPEFKLQDLDGKPVTLSGMKGRVVLLEFWATWCPPCLTSIPALEKLHKNYAGKGLSILAISVDQGGWDRVRTFSRERGVTYAVLKGTDEVTDAYGVRQIPATFLIDRQGLIHKRYLGEMSEERIEKDIQALL